MRTRLEASCAGSSKLSCVIDLKSSVLPAGVTRFSATTGIEAPRELVVGNGTSPN